MQQSETGFAPKLLDEKYRVGAKAVVHDHLIRVADEDGCVFTRHADVAAATGLGKGATRNALEWLHANGFISSIESGNRGRLTSIQLATVNP